MWNRRRFHMNIMSIRRRPSFDEFLHHFYIIFRCNLADRKTQVVSTYLPSSKLFCEVPTQPSMMIDDTVRLVCVHMLLLTDNEFGESQS